jgi:hypothetical protein
MTGNLFRNPTRQRENRSQAYATRARSDVDSRYGVSSLAFVSHVRDYE